MYVTTIPGERFDGVPDFCKLNDGLSTALETVLLSTGVESSVAVMIPEFLIDPEPVYGDATVTFRVTAPFCPIPRVPIFQLTTLVAALYVPPFDAEPNVSPDARVSYNATFVKPTDPLFRYDNV